MTDMAELIQADHVRISKMIGQLDSALAEPCPADIRSEASLVWEVLVSFLRMHVDAAAEIVWPALASADPDVTLAMMEASAANEDVREAMAEAQLTRPGSQTWDMAVRAACRAARAHVACVESSPLIQYRRHTSAAVRRTTGRHWLCFITAQVLDRSVQN